MELGMEEEYLHDTLRQEDQDILFGVASSVEDDEDVNVRDVRDRCWHTVLHGPAIGFALTGLVALAIGFGIGTAAQNWQIGVAVGADSAPWADSIVDGFGAPHRYRPNLTAIPRPPLSELVHNDTIVGDVSWALDFAIIGFPKVG